jgi:hypothetical protein
MATVRHGESEAMAEVERKTLETMKDLTIWTVYHRDEQVEQYGLQESETRRLY